MGFYPNDFGKQQMMWFKDAVRAVPASGIFLLPQAYSSDYVAFGLSLFTDFFFLSREMIRLGNNQNKSEYDWERLMVVKNRNRLQVFLISHLSLLQVGQSLLGVRMAGKLARTKIRGARTCPIHFNYGKQFPMEVRRLIVKIAFIWHGKWVSSVVYELT